MNGSEATGPNYPTTCGHKVAARANVILVRVPIDPNVLAAHIEASGPYLFHVADAAHREAILREGLRPASDTGRQVWGDFFCARPGHVYLCDRRRGVPVVPVEGERLTVQVDLRRLDPARFDTDEDVPYTQQRFQGKKWFDTKPPERKMRDKDTEADGQAGRLAAWAESIKEFDQPKFVERSLAAGRVAYRGTIPSEALQVIELASEVFESFAKRARELLTLHEIGSVPALAFQEVEADRALAIAQRVLETGLDALGRPQLSTGTDLSDAMAAYRLEDDFRRVGYEKNRAGEWEPRDLAFALAGLAKAVYNFDRALGWNPDACVSISEHAALCLPHIAAAASREAAQACSCRHVRALDE